MEVGCLDRHINLHSLAAGIFLSPTEHAGELGILYSLAGIYALDSCRSELAERGKALGRVHIGAIEN